MPRYVHPISLNEEQENKFQKARDISKLSIPDILMIAVEKLLKDKD